MPNEHVGSDVMVSSGLSLPPRTSPTAPADFDLPAVRYADPAESVAPGRVCTLHRCPNGS